MILISFYALTVIAATSADVRLLDHNASCQTPPLDYGTCSFYSTCLEAYYPCGLDGYALGYGDKYCHRFNSVETAQCMDEGGLEWVITTTACLQQELVPLLSTSEETLSCAYIKNYAFDSHPICYTGGGSSVPTDPSICFLAPSDWKCVLQTVDRVDLISPLGIRQEIEIAKICIDQLTVAGICDKDHTGDVRKSVKSTEKCEFWLNLLSGKTSDLND